MQMVRMSEELSLVYGAGDDDGATQHEQNTQIVIENEKKIHFKTRTFIYLAILVNVMSTLNMIVGKYTDL